MITKIFRFFGIEGWLQTTEGLEPESNQRCQ